MSGGFGVNIGGCAPWIVLAVMALGLIIAIVVELRSALSMFPSGRRRAPPSTSPCSGPTDERDHGTRTRAPVRMTQPTQLVLRAFLAEPTRSRYGLELCDLVGLGTGTMYPILARLERAGWLASHWEHAAQITEGRPRRRFYRITADGAAQAHDALARLPHSRADATVPAHLSGLVSDHGRARTAAHPGTFVFE